MRSTDMGALVSPVGARRQGGALQRLRRGGRAAGGRIAPDYPEDMGPAEYPDWHSALNRRLRPEATADQLDRNAVVPPEIGDAPMVRSERHLPSDLRQRGQERQGALQQLRRGGRARGYATGGGIGPFGGPGWAMPYNAGPEVAISPATGGAISAAVDAAMADPSTSGAFDSLANGSSAGGGALGAQSTGRTSSPGSLPSPSGARLGSLAGTGLGMALGLTGPAGMALSGLASGIGATIAANNSAFSPATQLSVGQALSGILNTATNPFGIFGKEGLFGVNPATSITLNDLSTPESMGFNIPTSSVDIGNSLVGGSEGSSGGSSRDPGPGGGATGIGHDTAGGGTQGGPGGVGGSPGDTSDKSNTGATGRGDNPGGGGGGGGGGAGGGGEGDHEGGGGCFVGETLVMMGDRSWKAIKDIHVGEHVMAFDGLEPLEPCRVEAVMVHYDRSVIDVNGILVTPEHRFLTRTGEWCAAGEFTSETMLVLASGITCDVVMTNGHLRLLPDRYTVYNLEVERLHTYVAGGFRVHNEKAARRGGRVHRGALMPRRRRGGALARIVP